MKAFRDDCTIRRAAVKAFVVTRVWKVSWPEMIRVMWAFRSRPELAALAEKWPATRLVEIWNGLLLQL